MLFIVVRFPTPALSRPSSPSRIRCQNGKLRITVIGRPSAKCRRKPHQKSLMKSLDSPSWDQNNLLITRRSWASSPSAAGGGSSEDEKGENKEHRGEPHPRRLYFRQGNEKSHPRNQEKPWNHNDSEAFFVSVRYRSIRIYSYLFCRLFVGNKSPFRINNIKIISKAS